jgi:hypothetical protein
MSGEERMSDPGSHFRTHEEEVWNKLSEALGGEFQVDENYKKEKVRIQDGPWTITLDHHCHVGGRTEKIYTRFRAPYINTDGFRFKLHRRSVMDSIVSLFGMNDLEIGDEELDRLFAVETNDPEAARKLLDSGALREHLRLEPDVYIGVRDSGDWFQDDYPDGVDELVLVVEDVVTDLVRLKRLYRLFAETLHRLCDIGSAHEQDPRVDA